MKIYISLSRNIYDLSWIDKKINSTTNPSIAKWIKSTFRNWSINEGPAIPLTEVPANAPDWAKTATDLYQLDVHALEDILSPIIDYLRHLVQINERFDRLSVPDAILKQKAWHDELSKAKEKGGTEDGIEVVKTYDDGYSWVKIYGKESLDREGNLMKHCVGSYFHEVNAGSLTIYSLRDPGNKPHATIEFDVLDKVVSQIKGNSNQNIKEKYQPYCLDFVVNFLAAKSDAIMTDGLTIEESKLLKLIEKAGNLRPAKVDTFPFSSFKLNLIEPALPVLNETEVSRVITLVQDKIEYRLKNLEFYVTGASTRRVRISPEPSPKHSAEALIFLADRNIISWEQLVSKYSTSGMSEITDLLIEHKLKTLEKIPLSNSYVLFKSYNKGLDPAIELISGEKGNATIRDEKGTFDTSLLLTTKSVTITQLPKLSEKLATALKLVAKKRQISLGFLTGKANILAFVKSLNVQKESENTQEVNYKNIKPKETIFYGKKALDLAKELDRQPIASFFKTNKIRISGYLYDYFEPFFALCFMTDKRKAIDYIKASKGMSRQLSAFTVLPGSIKAGAFYWGDTFNADKDYSKIQNLMPKLLPLTLDDITHMVSKDILNSNTAKRLIGFYGL